jgi:hypothetical protein
MSFDNRLILIVHFENSRFRKTKNSLIETIQAKLKFNYPRGNPDQGIQIFSDTLDVTKLLGSNAFRLVL